MAGPTNEFKNDIADEVATILSADFAINVTDTQSVPHFGNPAITFPNLDAKTQGCKLIDTCVLYIDIRRSTDLNLRHQASTLAKLYSAFVRAMTRCARQHEGHVRGIIGDRVMVLFDTPGAVVNAVDTAISMNSTAQYVINKNFLANDVTCGIGIDMGKMLATKTGIIKRGHENQNYKNLVWLGRPANVASKLTDAANKPEESVIIPAAEILRQTSLLGIPTWQDAWWPTVMNGFFHAGGWGHTDILLSGVRVVDQKVILKPATPPILMTEEVYAAIKVAQPQRLSIVNNWFDKVSITVPGYDQVVYGGDVFWKNFR
ncbi:conserved protein of unknown function(containing Adenylyl cyclase class-3/4/guanylyl cyclase domain,59-210) [Magnetospirillum sp. XM-1]|uniref:adenylate/guanylate cyclase domain-containing protein n=1 Tax=Magnetospirillum sp. XM-1 TaxID=1663591 RepID=UPI00073E0F51|nr:adenylate/guanylate cyclase domain-containing protein [Magnetospirillum sp. XM-1]CUW40071.1 conserved protein of unknown function(containing Adenylyl cyclase class-3/4/guanylyl cyclase domain,59-210) [Magnetospirillum sp. XM-1]